MQYKLVGVKVFISVAGLLELVEKLHTMSSVNVFAMNDSWPADQTIEYNDAYATRVDWKYSTVVMFSFLVLT